MTISRISLILRIKNYLPTKFVYEKRLGFLWNGYGKFIEYKNSIVFLCVARRGSRFSGKKTQADLQPKKKEISDW